MASEARSQGDPRHAVFAALPAAVGLTILPARILPVEFEARPNDLGIVSQTILNRYPDQQEIFWLLFGVFVASLLTWVGVRVAGTARGSIGRGIGLEVLGASARVAVLWLPDLAGAFAVALLVAAAGLWAAGAPRPLRVADYVLRNTRPEDPVLFLPNNASYYYRTVELDEQIAILEYRDADERRNP